MDNQSPNLRNVAKEVLSEGYAERARQRAMRRKSPWNLVLILFGVCGIGFIWYALFEAMWHVHTWFYPEHIGRFREFWAEDLGSRAFVSSFLLLIPLLFAAIPLGTIVANAVLWCIPPARRSFDQEAQGVKWASFPEAVKGLSKIALVMVSISLLLSFIGAAALGNLK